MKLLQRIVAVTFQGTPCPDQLFTTPELVAFEEGEIMKVSLISDGKTINIAQGNEKNGRVLVLERKNKEKLNPKRLCFDISSSVHFLGDIKESCDYALLAVVKMQGLMAVNASIKTRELTKIIEWEKRGISQKHSKLRGFTEIYQNWKSTYNDTLDQELKARMTYLINCWEEMESMLVELETYSEANPIRFDWCLDFINFAGSCLYETITRDSQFCPQRDEIKKIISGIFYDLIRKSEEEYSYHAWWASDETITRAGKWIQVFKDAERNMLENSKIKLKDEYKDPQIENQIKVLQRMIDIFEILKQANRFRKKNQILESQYKFFQRLMKNKQTDVLSLYNELVKSELLKELMKELKQVIRELTNSDQIYNTLNFLTQISGIVVNNIEFSKELQEDLKGLVTKIVHLKMALKQENETKIRQCNEFKMMIGEELDENEFTEFIASWLPLEKKISKIAQFLRAFFAHDEFYTDVQREATNTAKAIKTSCKELVTLWDTSAKGVLEEVKEELENEDLIDIDLDAGVMTFNFPEKLICLITTLERLQALGFDNQISHRVKEYVKEKNKVYNEAIKLKRVTKFYNSLCDLDSILMKCHRPLLLDRIVRLENVLKNMEANLDTKPENLRVFIKGVEGIINGFEKLNSKLKDTHSEIIQDFSILYTADLVAKKTVWKDTVERAKSKINSVTSEIENDIISRIKDEAKADKYRQKFKGYKLVWTNHMSFQLLKVLTYQLKKSMLGISAYIPNIEAKVKLSRGRLVVMPSIPEIRELVYSHINSMILFPKSLHFFDNWKAFLEFIPRQCDECLQIAYKEADKVVGALEAKLLELRQWVSLSCLDPAKIANKKSMNRGEIWKNIVETLKQKRRDLEREDDLLETDCVTLNIQNFKYQAEDAISNVLSDVMRYLEGSLSQDTQVVKEFLAEMTNELDTKPTSVEHLKAVWDKFDELQQKTIKFKPTMESLREKINLIISLGRAESSGTDIIKEWDHFESRILNFKEELREKQSLMKEEIEKQVIILRGEVEKFDSKWTTLKLGKHEKITRSISKDYIVVLKNVKTNWDELSEKIARVSRDLDHFGLNAHNIERVDELETEISNESKDWRFVSDFEADISKLEEKKHIGNPKTVFELQDLLVDWSHKIPNATNRVTEFIKSTVEDYQTAWPCMKLMIGEAFQREHWNSLMFMLGIQSVTTSNLTFGHLIRDPHKLLSKVDEIKELSARAQGEVTIREAIEELDGWCGTAEFELTSSKDAKGDMVPLIKEWNDMMTRVGDNQALLQSIKDSKFYARFKDRISQFDKRLGGLFNYLIKIQQIQRRWLYLEPIFGKGALPSQQDRFDSINSQFKSIMRNINRDKKIAMLNEINGIDAILDQIIEQIEVCQSALNKYLEDTRKEFPRFFFLGDDDLLEILGQSENPLIIQMHLKKIFAGIHEVAFKGQGSSLQIASMISAGGETVDFENPVDVNGKLESWLTSLEKQMVGTLQALLVKDLQDKQFNVSAFPAEILCLGKEIMFTKKVSESIQKNTLEELKSSLDSFLNKLTSTKSQLQKIDQRKVKSLIMDLIHQISIVDELIMSKVTSEDSWAWFKQLKYRFSAKRKIAGISMCKATFQYTYEYQGNPGKLVHTPLTDKCYLTLTQGMMLGFGGNPYGPAGTGKTESVKALGQAFARMVLVFNCDENLDYKSMGRIFIGLVKCGAWGCFDEFNRLVEEQLSAISQQIQLIQDAIKEKRKDLCLLGLDLEVDFNSGIFVTLNPAGKGYGGRSKLPDNLKQLFRPVAMSRPDNELIAEVMLYAEGFKSAKSLSNKIVSIFLLSNQILSKQQHYDWGLRALKSILTTAGEFIEIQRKKLGEDSSKDNLKLEAEILLKALNDNTTSKLTSLDLAKFNALINDVMPNIQVPEIKDNELISAIEKSLAESNLDLQDRQIDKILQFRSVLKQRMGVVIMGPSGSGKTTIWSILKTSLKKLGVTVKTYIMNPKAISRPQLLGFMDVNTREFKNGVLTAAARRAVKEPGNVQNWIICDGDVDPKWIEALNSVLDDNHLLTLPTGERIAFGSNVNFIFETHDLRFASPATVSRMGMIYLNDDDVNISSLVSKWRRDIGLDDSNQLSQLLKEFFEPVLKLLKENEEDQCVKTTQMGLIQGLLSQVKGSNEKKEFAVRLMRGLVSNFPTERRDSLMKALQQILGEKLAFISEYDPRTKIITQIKPIQSEFGNKMLAVDQGDICVKTSYVQANIEIIKKTIQENESLIVVGPQGSGKTLMIHDAIKSFSSSLKVKVVTIYCNSQTNSSQIIDGLIENCTKSMASTHVILRPKDCHRLILLLRDINLAKPDEYDSIELISFLQQLSSHRGFYDEDLEFTEIDKNIEVVVSMNLSSDLGRHELSTRLTATTRILFVDHPSKEDMKTIVRDLAEGTLQKSKKLGEILKANARVVDGLSSYLIELFEVVKKSFTPETCNHYQFSPKDITKILQNLLNYEVETKEDLIMAFEGECNLAFGNRLVGLDECSKYEGTCRKLAQTHLGGGTGRSDMLYTSLVKRTGELTKIPKDSYVPLLEKYILSFERENLDLGLCLTNQTIQMIKEVEKILCREGGKALLIGKSGTGKKVITKIICHALNIEVEGFYIGLGYGSREFRKDIRRILEIAGIQDKKVCILLEDYQIVSPSFLEDINSLLSSNQIPGIFSQEEVEGLLRDQAESLRADNYGKSVYECFLSRISKNLRIAISLEPGNTNLPSYLTNNPAILKTCDIVWLKDISGESLRQIAEHRLKASFIETFGADPSGAIYDSIVEIHTSCGETPREFFAMADAYGSMMSSKIGSLKSRTLELKSGLSKISEANVTVDELSKKASVQKKELSVKQTEADKFMKEIEAAYEASSDQKREAEEIRTFLKKEESKTLDKREQIEKELEDVWPIVEAAKKQVNSINKTDISELKSYKEPNPAVRDVFEAMFLLMGKGKISWSSIKKELGSMSFLDSITTIDPRSISESSRVAVNKFVNKNSGSFEKQAIYRVSKAAGPIAEFVLALMKLADTYHNIKPLEDQLADVDKKLEGSRNKLAKKDDELSKIDKRVAELKASYKQKLSESEVLKMNVQDATEKIDKAKVLLDKLLGEKSRWEKTVNGIQEAINITPRDSLLAIAFITYLSLGSEERREKYMKQFRELLYREDFVFRRFMSEESQILEYISEGLPPDQLTVENALVACNSHRTPLVIDPDNNLSEWIVRRHSSAKDNEIVFSRESKLMNKIELSIRFGKTLVVRDIDKIDPLFFSILKKDVKKIGPRMVVQIGEKVVDWNSDFKMIFLSRDSSLKLEPFASSLVNLINNLVTATGLSEKLLSIIINHERPDIEKTQRGCLEQERNLTIEISKLEEKLLKELGSTEGNILENVALLDSLNETKQKSLKIQEALEQSHNLQHALEKERNIYIPLAKKGTELYLRLRQMKEINHMYSFSLQEFIGVFKHNLSIVSDGGRTDTEDLIKTLVVGLFKMTFTRFGYCMFKRDKLSFALHIVREIEGACTELEFNFFLGRATVGESVVSLPGWADQSSHEQFSRYNGAFGQIVKGLRFDTDMWRTWFEKQDCEKFFPTTIMLKNFQKALLVQIFRPDRLESALEDFACKEIGLNNLNEAINTVSNIHSVEPSSEIPILFITSLGSDPSKELEDFAVEQVGEDKFVQLSMGGGQNENAIRLLEECATQGKWLFLKNIHLVPTFIDDLEKTLKKVQKDNSFKLWLTSEEQDKFSSVFLEGCFKVSYEAPPGIKMNVERIYQSISNKEFNKFSDIRARMIYLLSYFHAILQERRTYIPQGWSKYYEFSQSDFKAGNLILDTVMTDIEIDWPGLFGLFENAIYGGRIDKITDIEILKAYMRKTFTKEVLDKGKLPFGIMAPSSNQLKDHLKHLRTLPDENAPSVFGLPRVIESSLQKKNVQYTVKLLKSLGTTGNTKGQGNDDLGYFVNPFIKLWRNVYSKLISIPELSEKNSGSEKDVIASVVFDELLSRQKILSKLNSLFSKLEGVVAGKESMTSNLFTFAEALKQNKLPSILESIWDGCEDPDLWIKIIARKS